MQRHHRERREQREYEAWKEKQSYLQAYREAFVGAPLESRESTWRWELYGVDQLDEAMLSHSRTRYTGELP